MRSVINISLPPQLATLVEEAVSTGHYATKSEFFRSLLRSWQEEKLLKELKVSQEEFVFGQAQKLTSLKDLR
jgi:putative addiction module CopG family antidote